MTAVPAPRRGQSSLVDRLAWIPVGVLAAGVLSVVGIRPAPLGLLLAGLVAWRRGPRGAAFGIPAGIGVALFVVAYIQWSPGGFSGPHWAMAGAFAVAIGVVLDLVAGRLA